MNTGAPTNAVIAPTGNSLGAIAVRAIRSASTTNIAPANVTLSTSFPYLYEGNPRTPIRAEAVAYENTPTSVNWDFIVAQAICADQ